MPIDSRRQSQSRAFQQQQSCHSTAPEAAISYLPPVDHNRCTAANRSPRSGMQRASSLYLGPFQTASDNQCIPCCEAGQPCRQPVPSLVPRSISTTRTVLPAAHCILWRVLLSSAILDACRTTRSCVTLYDSLITRIGRSLVTQPSLTESPFGLHTKHFLHRLSVQRSFPVGVPFSGHPISRFYRSTECSLRNQGRQARRPARFQDTRQAKQQFVNHY